jgi:hypothetical protein
VTEQQLVDIANGDVWMTPERCAEIVAEVRRLRGLVEIAASSADVADVGGTTSRGCVFCRTPSFDGHAPDCPAFPA